MIKTIWPAHPKPGLDRAEYKRYWVKEHEPAAARRIPGVRKYVQNHFIEVPGQEYQGDGIVEMWYDSVESWQQSLAYILAPEGADIREDGLKFAEMKGGGFWVVEEHVIKDEAGR